MTDEEVDQILSEISAEDDPDNCCRYPMSGGFLNDRYNKLHKPGSPHGCIFFFASLILIALAWATFNTK